MRTLVKGLSTCALLLPFSLAAAPLIELGEEVHVQALICDSQAKAEAVIKTHVEQGLVAAEKLAGKTCQTARFIGTPLLVLATRTLGDTVLKVIQVQIRMADGTRKPYYLPTWLPVKAGKTV